MRILYIYQYFKTPSMSGGTRTYELARRFVAAGHDVDVVTTCRDPSCLGGGPFSTYEAGVHVHWIPLPYDNRMSFARRMQSFASFAFRDPMRFVEQPVDVVLASSTPLTVAVPGVRAAKRAGAPFVFEVRDLWPDLPIAIGALRSPGMRRAARRLERWAYRNSEAIVALSPGMKDGIAAQGFDRDRIAVIPNACDVDLFDVPNDAGVAFRASRPWIGGRPLIVYAGTLGRINGVDVLADVADALKKRGSDVCVLIMGDGSERERLLGRAHALGVLGDNLFYEPPIPKGEVPSALSAADLAACLFVDLPEMRANSANKFFDALASGTPVLINYGGWHDDLVRDDGIGVSIWKRDADQAAEAIEAFLRDEERRRGAEIAAKTLARRRFDRDRLAKSYEQLLSAVVSREEARLHALVRATDHDRRAEDRIPDGPARHGQDAVRVNRP